MNNRAVVLSVLEDLAHWSPIFFDSATASSTKVSPFEEIEASNPSSAGGVGESFMEPHSRKQARYRAVLQLPSLCEHLGKQWAEAEVAPYLLQCIAEEDAQLSFSVGIALLGLALPRSSSSVAPYNSNALMSLDAILPVLDALSATSERTVRSFVAQVVVPHLCFGVSLEQEVSLRSWGCLYLPEHVLSSVSDGYYHHHRQGGSGTPSTSLGSGAFNDGSPRHCDGDEEEDEAVDVEGCEQGVAASHVDSLATLISHDEATRLLILYEEILFLFDSCCTNLSLPLPCSPLPRSVATGLRDVSSGGRSRYPHPRRDPLLAGAQLAVFGASYAVDVSNVNSWDAYAINLKARALVSDVHSWIHGFVPLTLSCKPKQETQRVGGLPHPRDALYFVDYLEPASCRAALRARWVFLQRLLSNWLRSPSPCVVAAAVEVIAGLVHGLNWACQQPMVSGHCAPEAPDVPVVAVPPSLLRSPAELRRFFFATTRMHVACCVVAMQEGDEVDPAAALNDAHGALLRLVFENRLLQHVPAVDGKQRATLRLGPGPAESRALTHVAWDLSFAATDGATPEEAAFFDGTSGPHEVFTGTASLPARVIRISIISSLPFLLHSVFCTSTSSLPAGPAGGGGDSQCVTLDGLCELLTQILCPLPAPHLCLGQGDGAQSPLQLSSPSSRTLSTSTLVASHDCPASLNYRVLEAALSAMRRTIAEVAVRFPHQIEQKLTAASQDSARSTVAMFVTQTSEVCQRLLELYRDTVNAVPLYSSWKARWLFMEQLPPITAAFLLLLVRLSRVTVALTTGNHAHLGNTATQALRRALATATSTTYYKLCKLLTELWSHASGGALFRCIKDEEVEVRTVSAVCAARMFSCLLTAAARLAVDGASVCSTSSSPTEDHLPPPVALSTSVLLDGAWPSLLSSRLATLLQPLGPLLEVIMACTDAVLKDTQARVRCGAAEGLSLLARALSVLVVITAGTEETSQEPSPVAGDSAGPGKSGSSFSPLASVGKSVWSRRLSALTTSHLSLIDDGSSRVQLTLVSQLSDLMISTASTGATNGSVAQVRHEALLDAFRALAQHETWRFRERYAVLLADMCAKFLSPHHARCDLKTLQDGNEQQPQVDQGAPTNPHRPVTKERVTYETFQALYKFARCELLPLLVDVLFDRVSAVRQTALVATQRLCARVAIATTRARARYQQDDRRGGPRCTVHGMRRRGKPASGSSSRRRPVGEGDGLGGNDDDVFVNDVMWPLIIGCSKAWATYLTRSALLRIAVALRVDKTSILLPLLDQLAHDPVLNVRLVVAKTLREVLERNTTRHGAAEACLLGPLSKERVDVEGKENISAREVKRLGPVCGKVDEPDMYPLPGALTLPPLTFTEEEKNGPVLALVRQLLEDASADVRDEAARALEVSF